MTLPACTVAQQAPQSNQGTRQDGVVQLRGDHVMGFSHDLTTHHFRLLKDGDEIIVVANDSTDKASIAEIEMHLGHIAKMFSDGDFNAPMLIHDTNPPGVATMTRLKGQIRYEVTEIQRAQRFGLLPLALKPPMRYTHSFCFKLSIPRQAIRLPSPLINRVMQVEAGSVNWL